MNLNQYLLIIFTVLVIYEVIFSILIRPYYVKKLFDEHITKLSFPEVSVEAFILLTVVLGLAFGSAINTHPFLILGPVFLVYGIASINSKFRFYAASALLFNFYRDKSFNDQMHGQKLVITYSFFIFSVIFFFASYLVL